MNCIFTFPDDRFIDFSSDIMYNQCISLKVVSQNCILINSVTY